jgi:hypothetical protein
MTFRCSELSLELGEPLMATAPFAPRWELVEREKPWGRDHGLSRPDAKVLLVRRAGAAPAANGRRYLVCTNGARDPCCARLGSSVAAAIERARPGRAYECSHLGGHRFAANVLVLPDGLCFGRLDVRSALALVEDLDAGRLPLEHVRGRSSYSPEQQAAEILVRRKLGLSGLDDIRLHNQACGSEPQSPTATFELADGRLVTASLRAELLPPRRVSCRDEKLETPTKWTLAELVAQSH